MIAGWNTHSINDCCEILDSQRVPLNAEQRSKIPGDIPYFGANGVQGYINQFLFDEELILMAEDGGNFDQFATRPIAYKISGKSWVNNHAHILRAKNGFNQDFVFYSIVHKNILYFIQGGTRSKLNQSDLKSITLQIPNSETEQSTIATILTTIDQAIEKTEQLIAKYERMKTGMMQDLLTRGIDDQGNIRSEETHEFKDSPLGRVPKEWEVYELGGLVNFSQGIQVPIEMQFNLEFPDSVRFIRIVDYTQNTDDIRYIFNPGAKYVVDDNDVVMVRYGTPGFIGRGIKGAIANNMFKISPNKELVSKDYLATFLKQNHIQNLLLEGSGSTTMAAINFSFLKTVKIMIPKSLDEQSEIVKKIISMQEIIQYERESINNLKKQKIGLMQDLLTGNVRVDALLN